MSLGRSAYLATIASAGEDSDLRRKEVAIPIPSNLRQEIDETLTLIPRWHLDATGWERVRAALVQLHESVRDERTSAAVIALRALDAEGPRRLARISLGEDEGNAPPAIVMELLNTLVHPPPSGSLPADELHPATHEDGSNEGLDA